MVFFFFSHARLVSLIASVSDHVLIQFCLFVGLGYLPKKRFKFENVWLKETCFYDSVINFLNSQKQVNLLSKLAACTSFLSTWSQNFSLKFHH